MNNIMWSIPCPPVYRSHLEGDWVGFTWVEENFSFVVTQANSPRWWQCAWVSADRSEEGVTLVHDDDLKAKLLDALASMAGGHLAAN